MTKRFLQPKTLIIAFAIIVVLMVSSALIELNQSKIELLDLMKNQAHTLLETTITSSQNSILTNRHLEQFIEERLFNNANFIRILFEQNKINNQFLSKFADENNIFRINIWNSTGQRLFSSHEQFHTNLPEKQSPQEILNPIFMGIQDTLLVGLKEARFEYGIRYAVAIATKNRNAIVLNLDAQQLLEFRKQIGFGKLLQNIAINPGIVYVALQDSLGIIAASDNITELERINDSSFLNRAVQDSIFSTREITFANQPILEAVHPFYYEDNFIGLFRIGFSLVTLEAINSRIYRRIIIITIIIIFIGIVLFTLLIARQNLDFVKRQYQVVETYSSNIIHSVSDAVVVSDSNKKIKLFNRAAEKIFLQYEKDVIDKPIHFLFEDENCITLLNSSTNMKEIVCDIQDRKKYLLISRSEFKNEKNEINQVFVIRDLTNIKQMEQQIQREERLTAMGELASGVAHEIRNPLNTIGTIVQQLDKDFEPVDQKDEYHELSKIVYKEVKRINETVQDFLRFARPEPITPELFKLQDFFTQLNKQYQAFLGDKNIQFQLRLDWNGEVYWDRQQMQQVFMNLFQNSIDALKNGGHIKLTVQSPSIEELEINFQDNGTGIPEKIKSKIFNLYFTTKAKGTGIGLSIVQRIVYEQGGMISIESSENSGTIFVIRMPKKVEKMM